MTAKRKKHSKDKALAAAFGRAKALIVRRSVEMLAEFEWALGEKSLPRSQVEPPEWVRFAILEGCAPMVAFRKDVLNPKPEQLHGLLMRGTGVQMAILPMLENPPPSIASVEKEIPEFVELRKEVAGQIVKKLKPTLTKQGRALKRLVRKGKPANAKQVRENLAMMTQGAGELVGLDGEMKKWDQKTTQLCLAMWFHWPSLKLCANAREVHAALDGFTGSTISLKLVEKKCSDFGIFAGKRGRPAK